MSLLFVRSASGDNDVVCVLWICVVVGTESYVCDQLPKLPEEPPPIGDCASAAILDTQKLEIKRAERARRTVEQQ